MENTQKLKETDKKGKLSEKDTDTDSTDAEASHQKWPNNCIAYRELESSGVREVPDQVSQCLYELRPGVARELAADVAPENLQRVQQ